MEHVSDLVREVRTGGMLVMYDVKRYCLSEGQEGKAKVRREEQRVSHSGGERVGSERHSRIGGRMTPLEALQVHHQVDPTWVESSRVE